MNGDPVILGWGRSAVTPLGGALARFDAHEIGAPVVRGILARFGIPAAAVDAVVAGNALGAGGNPARMLALAAALPDRTAALSIDTQCCAGLDAVSLAAAMIASGAASLVVAGGLEAWSRAPIRQARPVDPHGEVVAYDRPPFAPDPHRDPDLLLAAARFAARAGISRERQDRFAAQSHARALALRARMSGEVVVVGSATEDSYARVLSAERMARMPIASLTDEVVPDGEPREATAVSRIAVSPRADGAAFVVLAARRAALALGLTPHFHWRCGVSIGAAPEMPMLAAIDAARAALEREKLPVDALWGLELHEAFAVQALAFIDALGVQPARLNRGGGGLGRGHPIGASGAISLVRLLSDMQHEAAAGARGLVAIAGAGGVGAAAIVERL